MMRLTLPRALDAVADADSRAKAVLLFELLADLFVGEVLERRHGG